MLEHDGSEENPLYLEEKKRKILSYYLNVSPMNMGKGGKTQALVSTFKAYFVVLFQPCYSIVEGQLKQRT